MVELTRIYVASGFILLTATFIFHIVAMSYNNWKIYENRSNVNDMIYIGIFRRCEPRSTILTSTISTTHLICDDNKYCFYGNSKCPTPLTIDTPNLIVQDDAQKQCNLDGNPLDCGYSSITKGLISCTIIAACFIGFSLLLTFSHILFNQFNYKLHFLITLITIIFLMLGFAFILTTLILLGSTMSSDLYQYRYNRDYRLQISNNDALKTNFTETVKRTAADSYDVRIDWSCGLEICALILSTFSLLIQIIYLISIHRNRFG